MNLRSYLHSRGIETGWSTGVRPRLARAGGWVGRWTLRIALPLIGAAAMLRLFPYRGTAADVGFRAEGTLVTRPGFSVDTTFGSWEFPDVNALPVGVHIRPEDVDVVGLAAIATQDGGAFAERLRSEIENQVPSILAWLAGTALIGVLLGLAAAALVNLAVRQLRGRERRPDELGIRVRQLATAGGVVVVVAAVGAATYNPQWAKDSRTTGTIAALQLFPDQLDEYYAQGNKFTDVLGAVASIQADLQGGIDDRAVSAAAFRVMHISDMHLARNYPLVSRYVDTFEVDLVVNTGDEAAFGTAAEMTAGYRAQIRELTEKVPMIWVAGNHDSPTTVDIMRSIPGVVVLGDKQAEGEGFVVTAEQVDAFGLRIGGVADPRVYGASGDFGADAREVVDPLQRNAVDTALVGVGPESRFDVFLAHEPVATERIVEVLDGRVRQVNSGHTHVQNGNDDVQRDGYLNLVEGSTGAGGLDNLNRDEARPPIEFTVETVGIDCTFTKVVRVQLPATATDSSLAGAEQQVRTSTLYLPADEAVTGRVCSTALGIGEVTPVA
jgi:hypothetical protein